MPLRILLHRFRIAWSQQVLAGLLLSLPLGALLGLVTMFERPEAVWFPPLESFLLATALVLPDLCGLAALAGLQWHLHRWRLDGGLRASRCGPAHPMSVRLAPVLALLPFLLLQDLGIREIRPWAARRIWTGASLGGFPEGEHARRAVPALASRSLGLGLSLEASSGGVLRGLRFFLPLRDDRVAFGSAERLRWRAEGRALRLEFGNLHLYRSSWPVPPGLAPLVLERAALRIEGGLGRPRGALPPDILPDDILVDRAADLAILALRENPGSGTAAGREADRKRTLARRRAQGWGLRLALGLCLLLGTAFGTPLAGIPALLLPWIPLVFARPLLAPLVAIPAGTGFFSACTALLLLSWLLLRERG